MSQLQRQSLLAGGWVSVAVVTVDPSADTVGEEPRLAHIPLSGAFSLEHWDP